MLPALHHIALKARDPRRLAPFYRDVLGFPELSRHVDESGLRSVWLDLGGTTLMIERSDTEGPVQPMFADPPGLHMLAFRIPIEQRGAWIERMAEAGVQLQTETAHSVYFLDPEGHRFALSHHPEPVPAP